ncbi:nuclear transport factor 2 family protein [Winogradskyella sp. SYSU M77433]|uniref:nuclear transport factor 2 family protein n=1 Tax=Winogradskyella sp. SYSU M77433 TaxID=3042722 RepID=UPI0024816816|nr:nuclear transport factor 2 family protein [Winogradskyella sp. SYSU M77433]MDH7912425.1 nuclear transport factor 2 family protein [Winogradskyella sp. SYSU M77433]|tara:strand:+ start:611 stop:1066 length:456 start_codon:yes stop_codon:yes gene_type:complete
MKQLLLIFSFLFVLSLQAQNPEEKAAKQAVVKFFEAFHKQDTIALRAMTKGDVRLQSISVDKEGKSILNESKYGQFLKNIASIPKDRTFEEKLLDFNVQVDGNMANVWTPYEFWYQGKMSHCGVNSFQLMKEGDSWKIIYLVDTRRREGCK